jgi:hypothetical protein
MIRLDWTSGFRELVPTGLLRPMVRLDRTMTIKGGRHAVRHAILARMGSSPRMTMRGRYE